MNWRSSREMDPMLLLVFLFLLLLCTSHSQTPCETHKVASKLETNCESLGLKSVPLKLPPDTAILLLQNNGLQSFSTSSLSLLSQLTELNLAKNNMSVLKADEKLPLLSILDLSDNNLQTLPQLRYSLPSLTSLDLSRNALKSLSLETLAGLDSLENLYLRGNKLRSLPPKFLKGASKLQKLDLANNYLEQLSADLLADLDNLNTLFLQNNLLSVLPSGFFGNNLLPYVFLHSNPWNCNCELQYLRHWLQENQGNVYLWKEGLDVKVMTPDVKSVQCDVPSGTPVYTFSANCPISGDYDYDSYDGYDGLTVKGVPEPETTTIPTTISLEHSTVLKRSKKPRIELTLSPITSEKNTFPNTRRSIIFLNSSETTLFPTMPEFTKFLTSEATTLQITLEPTVFSENLETARFPASPEAITFPVTLEKTTFPNPRGSTIFLNNPETAVFPTMPELTRFLISSETTTLQISPENTTFPTTQSSTTTLLNSPETTVFPTMPELTTFFISSEATTIQVTPEPTTFTDNLETTRFPTSLEAATFPVTSEKTMLQTTPELVTFPTTNSIVHTSSLPVTFPSPSSTLTLPNSNILPPNEALGSLGDPSDSSPLSISCCLLSLRFYIFGIAWVLVSSIVLILFLALAQPPPHLPRTHAFMEDIPKPQATAHLELLKGKEVIVPRACLLYLEGLIPSFRTRLFLWVQSNGRVGPLTLKRKPSAISLGRGEDLLGSVSIRYSGHSL
ncbi:platelet glycoprotein Ib alpha chain [Phascolarctos cinereus]|uniref:Platelet glycoprotein Ib alpha chain n=1 Tax=Phascolarctos cinereus TaxID=38626 RepID=A0A6P5IK54_PHACI|nr:platelet glycoprotein Ib alpha chain [Phascolarctos cinereus]